MKKNLLVLFSAIMLLVAGVTISRAAFPVSAPSSHITSVAPGNSSASNETMSRANDETVAKATTSSAPAHPGSSNKSQIVALILCFFLGGIGIHRFYLGYTWQGVVQLLTGGGCGIWALIDFIRIIIGDLQPKDGSYGKTL